MSSEQRTIHLKSLDKTAIVEAATGETADAIYNSQTRLFEFAFTSTPEVRDAIVNSEMGLKVDAMKLLECRARLYRRIKGGRI